MKFARARAAEIAALAAGVLHKNGGGRRTFQRLPRQLRRRSMSHNVHRVPASHRARAAANMAEPLGVDADLDVTGTKKKFPKSAVAPALSAKHKKKRRTRRYWRRPAHVQEALHERKLHGTGEWLPTHIWHAKRMRMAARWGIKLALRRADKGMRASYREAAYRCAIHDSSFVRCVQLSGPHDAVSAVLAAHTGPSSLGVSVTAAMHTLAGRTGSCVLYRANQRPHGALCGPVSFLWRPQSTPTSATIWLWVHIASLKPVLEELSATAGAHPGVLVESREHDLVRFDLIGPRSTPLLCSVLHPALLPKHTDTSQLGAATELWNTLLRQAPTPDALPVGCCFALTATTPPRPPVVSAALRAPRTKGAPGDGVALIRAISAWDTHCVDFSVASSPLWTGCGEWSQEREAATAAAATATTIKESKQKQQKKKRTTEPETVPVILMQQPGCRNGLRKGFGAGWTVVAPEKAAQTLWLALVHSGAHAVGLIEREWFEFERGAPAFPRDWPDTDAARQLAMLEATEMQAQHDRRPLGKKPNFERLHVTSPFAIDWSLLLGAETAKHGFVVRESAEFQRLIQLPPEELGHSGALIMGHVKISGGGRPAARALLCKPELGDKERCSPKSTDKIPLTRSPVGFVTTASFSFAYGCGFALAFCSLAQVKPLLQKHRGAQQQSATLLVRNVSSERFFIGIFTLVF